ncbi:MAG: AMP-binding protein, partial [Acidobacteriota bacterium]
AAAVLTIDELRRFLRERLPEYMIPSIFVMMDSLPLTSNGKINRQALPLPEQAEQPLMREYIAPRTSVERLLVEIWSQVLGIEKVGINDNFFALGGDSMRSIQVLAQAQKMGLNLTIRQMFQHQTICELAQIAQSQQESLSVETTISSREPFSLISREDYLKMPEDVEDAYPLSMLQTGMVFHSEYEPGVYHSIISYHLRGPIDLCALQKALDQLIVRHPMLRTEFKLTGFSQPLQLVHKTAYIQIQVEDLCQLFHSDQEKVIDEWLKCEKAKPFDWSRYPLLSLQVHLRSENTLQLTMITPHAIFDGWSDSLFVTELLKRYISILKAEPSTVEPPPASPFRDYIALEQEALHSEECRQYWERKLDNSSFLKLPRWPNNNGVTNSTHSQYIDIPISDEVSQKLVKLAQMASVPLKSVLLTAHLKVLSIFFGQSDVTTGMVLHGRPETVDGERIIGLFLNTLPFRLELQPGSWIDLVQQTFEAENELLPYRRYPMAQMLKDKGGRVLFETCFTYLRFHALKSVKDLKEIEVLSTVSVGETNFPFLATFNVDPYSDNIKLSLGCSLNEIPAEQLAAIAGYYSRTLLALSENPYTNHYDQNLLSEQERYQLFHQWNDTNVQYRVDRCIHELFEEQVERSPESVAVVFEDQMLSYRELNNRANQLAHYLQAMGVGPDQLVGICMERSIEMVVAILGILKAGGAYLPLDPIYPVQRIAFMLTDADVSVLLTHHQLLVQLPQHNAKVICLDSDWSAIAAHSSNNLGIAMNAEHLAYVIYTSGSTGKPKGVLVTHRNVVRLFAATQEHFHFDATDVWTMFHSYAFDFSVWELWGGLLYGGRVVVVPYLVSRTPESFYELIEREAVTVVNQTPSAFRQFIRVDAERGEAAKLRVR